MADLGYLGSDGKIIKNGAMTTSKKKKKESNVGSTVNNVVDSVSPALKGAAFTVGNIALGGLPAMVKVGQVANDNKETIKSKAKDVKELVKNNPRDVVELAYNPIGLAGRKIGSKQGLKTAGNIATNMGEGAIKTGEGILDTLNDISDAVNNPLTYAGNKAVYGKEEADKALKESKKKQEEFIKRDLTKDFTKATGFEDMREQWEDGSLVKSGNIGGQVAQGVGGMIPSLLAGQYLGFAPELTNTANLSGKAKALASLGNVGKTYLSQLPANAILTGSSYGSGLEEALNEGATREQARRYGLTNAAIEQGTEMMTGGIPGLQGKGGIDNYIDPLINKNTNGYLNALLRAGYGALGEGLEESTGTYLNALAKKGILGKDINWDEVNKEALQSGLVGAATGAILNAPANIQNIQDVRTENKVRNALGDSEYAEGNSQYNPDYKGWEKQREENRIEAERKETQDTQRRAEFERIQQERQEEARKAQEMAQEEQKAQERINEQETSKQAQKEAIQPQNEGRKTQDIKEFKDVKEDYKQYYKNADMDNFDSAILDKAKDTIQGSKRYGRTKQQWLDVADNIGLQLRGQDIDTIKKYAFESFKEQAPNRNFNKQGKGYNPFGVQEWVQAVYNGAKVNENTQQPSVEAQNIEEGINTQEEQNTPQNTNINAKTQQQINNFIEHGGRVEDTVPEGFIKTEGATTAPRGYTWYNNGKSRFGGEYENVLVKDSGINQSTNENVAEEKKEPVIKTDNKDLVKTEEYKEAQQKVKDRTATEKERRFIRTATEAQETQDLIKDMEDVEKNYEVLSNEKTLKQAETKMSGYKTLEEKADYIKSILSSGKRITASDIASAELVLRDAAIAKNSKIYTEVLADTAILGTEYGQAIQAMSMIKKMSPTGQLDVLEKIINREKAKGNKAYDNLEITDEMRNKIFDCYDSEGNIDTEKFENTMEDIKQELADNLKVGWKDKVRAWRYLSMLGNPKTHVRNMIANVAMSVVKGAKDVGSGAMQDVLIKDKAKKTRTLKTASKDVKNLSSTMWEDVKDMTSGNKYNEQSDLENRAKTFKLKNIEGASNINEKLLSAEDQAFKKINFKKSFANYLTAQGISTQEDIQNNPKIIEKAKQFALEEANVATFNQQNKLSEFINSADNKLGGWGKVIRGAIVPFTRTPLNIARTGLEYTPGTGLITTIDDMKKAPKDMRGNVLIDGISKQVTGSALALIGYALAKSGIVTAGTDDDKEGKFEKDMGSKMDYSIKIGDTSYDLSWLSPSSMPFFVGARMFEVLDKQEGINENLILESIASTLDPLSEMSVIQSFTDVLSSYSQEGTGKIKDMATSTLQSYLSQFVPTTAGQFARLFDDTKRTTMPDVDAPNKISQETYRKLAYKIPGLRNTLPATTDYYGEEKKEVENPILRGIDAFLNPMNHRKDTLTDEDKEIIRVYNQTGNKDMLPAALSQSVKFNNTDYKMTRKEYNKFKKDFGDSFKENLKDLMETNGYKEASDDEKSEMIEGLMKYSKDKTKDIFLTDKGEDYRRTTSKGEKTPYESDKVDELTNDNFSISDYYIYKTNTPNIVNGSVENVRKRLNFINVFDMDNKVFSQYMDEIGNIKGDKDENGKTIRYSKRKKVFDYINDLDLTKEQKIALMKKSDKAYRSYDRQLFNTINNSDLTLEEKESLKNFLKIGE